MLPSEQLEPELLALLLLLRAAAGPVELLPALLLTVAA